MQLRSGRKVDVPAERVRARLNATFTLERYEAASTGYWWKVKMSPGIRLVSDQFNSDTGSLPVPGNGGRRRWTFIVENQRMRGKTLWIRLTNSRSWERLPGRIETLFVDVA